VSNRIALTWNKNYHTTFLITLYICCFRVLVILCNVRMSLSQTCACSLYNVIALIFPIIANFCMEHLKSQELDTAGLEYQMLVLVCGQYLCHLNTES